jgi:hypothetical protein
VFEWRRGGFFPWNAAFNTWYLESPKAEEERSQREDMGKVLKLSK